MPLPGPRDQLWDILRLAPPNYRRIHIACSGIQQFARHESSQRAAAEGE